MSSNHDTPSSREASNRAPDGPAVGPDGDTTGRSNRLGRRTFVKGIGATAVAAAGLSYDRGFVQNAEAAVPLVPIGIAISVGWLLREQEIIGADDPATGLTGDVLKQEVYETARTRQSTNRSTIVDNGNLSDGVEHTAYTEAKVAAIEALNDGQTEANVLSTATTTIDSYEDTILNNLFSSWNESVREWRNAMSSLRDHPDFDPVGGNRNPNGTPAGLLSFDITGDDYRWEVRSTDVDVSNTVTYTTGGGTDITVHRPSVGFETWDSANSTFWGPKTAAWSPLDDSFSVTESGNSASSTFNTAEMKFSLDGNSTTTLDRAPWNTILREIETKFTNVRNGISTWVSSVYDSVASGDIEVSDLVTPKERAAMMADGEDTSQAIADLIALNVPVDLEREATITIEATGAKLHGTFGLTDEADGPLEAATTYDATTFAGDVYFTADMSLAEGEWTAINTTVDGGNITITEEPYEGTAIEVTTTAGDTVSVPATDWTDNGDGTWTYDASGDLDTNITEVESARFHSTATETQYETLNLDGSFTVNTLTNTETGEQVTSTDFTSSTPQDDSNYITQSEWDDLEQQNKELIEKYEDSQNSGGGLDLSGFDMFGIPGEVVAIGGAAIAAFGFLNK